MSFVDVDQAVREIDQLDLSFLKSDFQHRHGYSDDEFNQAVGGLKRFFSMTVHHHGPLAVTNKAVDVLWHTFIVHTPQYRAFCTKAFGGYLDHQPNGPATPVSSDAFTNLVEAHRALYGPLDEMWVGDLPSAARTAIRAGRAPSDLTFLWSGWPGRSQIS